MDMAQDESLPNRFPPQRQSPQYYGMVSDYARGHVMTQSVPTISPTIEGGTAFPDDDIEPLPMYRRIQPVIHDRRDLTWRAYPDLDVSPEPSPHKKKGTRKSNFAASSSMQRGSLIETKTPKVRFDQMVTVKRISPPREAEQSDIIEIDRSDDTSHELSFDDETPFGDENESDISVGKENIETLPKTYSYDAEDRLYDSDPIQNIITHTSRLNVDSNMNTGLFDESRDTELNSNQQILKRKIAISSAVKNQHQKYPPSTGIIEVQAQKMSSAKGLLIESGQTEHALARPEFNSTLFMRKEVEHATGETIDVLSAVSNRLKKSSETRRRVLEKVMVQLYLRTDQKIPLVALIM